MLPLQYDSARAYFTVKVTTASSRRTICFIHEQCTLLLQKALLDESSEKRRTITDRVQNLLSLLERSLRLDDPIAESLLLLYDYCYCQLETTETDSIRNSLSILGTLRTTFEKLRTSG